MGEGLNHLVHCVLSVERSEFNPNLPANDARFCFEHNRVNKHVTDLSSTPPKNTQNHTHADMIAHANSGSRSGLKG